MGRPPAQLPALCELPSLRHVSELTLRADWSLPAHSHADFNETIFVAAGAIEAQIAGGTLRGGVGSLLVYPRGLAHAERSVGKTPLRLLYLVWRGAGGDEVPPAIAKDRVGRMQLLIRWMMELHPPRTTRTQLTLDALLQALLHEHADSAAHPEAELVSRVRQFVYGRLARPIQLDDLAELAGMSKYYFARRFARAAGRPPMRFVRELRVEAARSLLLTSPMPLRAIAPLVGFADEFELSRVFRRVTGQPPGSVRGQGAGG